ncbi:hypothetical protein HU200_020206 [Digitaria exilis]|uniref:PB1 domain-containing protein n=1 Tax=Digitaria exilis TaxID=1010633 RepID=A0A835F1N9_9POAL|nr:hypothetical protein HU200_020206 [Digitaria exilis]
MDPNSSYLLEIRLFGTQHKKLRDYKCLQFTKVVDSDLCNFKDLVEEITDMFPHGYEEAMHVFYYDDVQNKFPLVTTDQQLLEMFAKHVDRKVVRMTVTYSGPTDGVPIPEPILQENSAPLDIPCTPSMPCPSIAAASQLTLPSTSHPNDPNTNEPTASDYDQSTDSDSDQADDDDIFLSNPQPQNEHVGVDDEVLYLPAPLVTSVDNDSKSDSDSDEEYEEEDGLIGKDPPPPISFVAYDKAYTS